MQESHLLAHTNSYQQCNNLKHNCSRHTPVNHWKGRYFFRFLKIATMPDVILDLLPRWRISWLPTREMFGSTLMRAHHELDSYENQDCRLESFWKAPSWRWGHTIILPAMNIKVTGSKAFQRHRGKDTLRPWQSENTPPNTPESKTCRTRVQRHHYISISPTWLYTPHHKHTPAQILQHLRT